MAISYRDPFEQLQRELETMLERAFGTEGASALYPPVNLFDARADYVVKAELPGVEPADLELTVQDNTLVLRGERRLPEAAQNAAYHRRERGEGQFRRVVRLPGPTEGEPQAQFWDGVLTVRLPKASQARPRRVTIHSD